MPALFYPFRPSYTPKPNYSIHAFNVLLPLLAPYHICNNQPKVPNLSSTRKWKSPPLLKREIQGSDA